MDWKDVGAVIAPLAPSIGSIIGGFIPFPGAGIAGQALGNLIAKKFGVAPTPEAVGKAIQTSPNDVAIANLKSVAEEARAMWPAYAQAEEAYYKAQAAIAESVNATMRVELEHQHWFFTGWRPAAGWVFVIVAAAFGAILMWASGRAVVVSSDPLATISDAWPIFAAYFGTLAAMVGVYIVGRTQEKVNGVTVKPAAVVVPPAPAKPVVKRP